MMLFGEFFFGFLKIVGGEGLENYQTNNRI